MTSKEAEYGAYRSDVISSPILPIEWMRILMGYAVDALWAEDVVVDYVWFVISSYPWAYIRAIVCDADEKPLEATIECAFDESTVSQPLAQNWALVSIELDEVPKGLLN